MSTVTNTNTNTTTKNYTTYSNSGTSSTNKSSSTKSSSGSSSTVTNPGGVLGKDAFLKLMLAQLQNQDPLEPTDDKEFIAQMASFSSLEQMNNMADGFTELVSLVKSGIMSQVSMQQATGYLGAEIEYTKTNEDKTTTTLNGIVSSVRLESGTPVLMVNGNKVQLSDVTSVSLPSAVTTKTSDTADA